MKKLLFYSMLMGTVLFSCKKDHSSKTNTDDKTYSVKFSVTGLTPIPDNVTSKQVNSLKADDVSIPANSIKILYYNVFDPSGILVHTLKQDSTSSNLGEISDDLPAGVYTVVIAAGQGGFNSPETTKLSTAHYNQLFFTYGTLVQGNSISVNKPWRDSFLSNFQLTVTDAAINQAVTLSRIVGGLDVKILDAIPATASTLSITVGPEYAQYNVQANTISGTIANLTTTITIPVAAKGTTNYTVPNYMLNTTTPFSVSITCYDAAKHILGSASVDGVTCQKNTKTILSGNLFGSNNTFNVSLSPWGPAVTIPFSLRGTAGRVNALQQKKGN